jgi:hypothetical protein
MAHHPAKSDGSPDPEAGIVARDGTDDGRKNHVRDVQFPGGARVHGGRDEHRLPGTGMPMLSIATAPPTIQAP